MVNFVALTTVMDAFCLLYSAWRAFRMVTREVFVNPWLPPVVTSAVVPVRTIDVTGTVTVAPKLDARILLFVVAKSLSACVRFGVRVRQSAAASGQYVYT